VAVVGACGGAGASSCAAALAAASARDRPTSLVDLDRLGGIDVLLGIEGVAGARWPDLRAARGDVDPGELVASLPRWRRLPVLSGDHHDPDGPDEAAVPDVLRALARGHRLVLDVPRWRVADPASRVLEGVGVVVLVVPLSVPALAGAVAIRQAAASAAPGPALAPWDSGGGRSAGPSGGARWVVVVREVRGAELTPDDVSGALGVDVVARAPHDRGARAAVERGDGPAVGRGSPWRRAAEAVLRSADGVGARSLAGAGGAWA
jgi:hypothetical protein